MRQKWYWLLGIIAVTVIGCGKKETPDAPAKATAAAKGGAFATVHFVGGAAFISDPNVPGLTNLFTTPEAKAFWNQTLDKLARTPFALLQSRIAGTTNDFAPLLRPLLDDLKHAESYFEARGESNQTPELAFAIKLSPAQAEKWRSNLSTVLKSWTGISPTDEKSEGVNGWQLKKHDPPNLARVVEVNGWVVVGCGQDGLPLNDEIVKRIKADSRPVASAKDYWLKITADWSRLSQWVTPPPGLEQANTWLTWVGGGGNFHVKAEIQQPKPMAVTLEPWGTPTNLVRDPLIGFAAVRGVKPWLQSFPPLASLKSLPLPNQILVWTLGEMPFQTYAAFPAEKTSNLVSAVGTELATRYNTNLALHKLGAIESSSETNSEAMWRGLFFVSPFLNGVRMKSGEYAVVGLAPFNPRSEPAPEDLWRQLQAHTNTVYYEWELTGERLRSVRFISQLAMLTLNQPQLNDKMLGFKWLDDVSTNSANTVSELSLTAPDTLSFSRRASVTLNALELNLLVNWLERTNFPAFDLSFAARTNAPRKRP